jgi:hypothetical protein
MHPELRTPCWLDGTGAKYSDGHIQVENWRLKNWHLAQSRLGRVLQRLLLINQVVTQVPHKHKAEEGETW